MPEKLSLFDSFISLRSLIKDRDAFSDVGNDAENQLYVDEGINRLLMSLKQEAAKNWFSLCENAEPKYIYISGLTYCQDFTWPQVFYLAERIVEPITPLSLFAASLSFSCFSDLKKDKKKSSLAHILGKVNNIQHAAIQLAMLNTTPIMDLSVLETEKLDTSLACQISWFLARDGFDQKLESMLFKWHNRVQDKELMFWAGIALVLRTPSLHNKISVLGSLNDGTPSKNLIIEALSSALEAGPMELAEAKQELLRIDYGTRSERLSRTLRFAAYSPSVAPIVDPTTATTGQRYLIGQLRHIIDNAEKSNTTFIPKFYINREIINRERQIFDEQIIKAIKAKMISRRWTEIQVEEALANGDGVPVTGYKNGEARRFIHPETGCSLVIDSKTSALLHVGRPDYVYCTPGDASMNAERRLHASSGSAYPRPVAPDARTVMVMMPLRNEYIDVWRPVQTRQMDDTTYCILPMQNSEPDEDWAFNITSYVFCQNTKFSEGVFLSALRLVTY